MREKCNLQVQMLDNITSQQTLKCHFPWRTADFQPAEGKELSIFQSRQFDEIVDVVFRHGARTCAVAVEISLLKQRAMLALLGGHIPKSGSNLKGFGFAESCEHF